MGQEQEPEKITEVDAAMEFLIRGKDDIQLGYLTESLPGIKPDENGFIPEHVDVGTQPKLARLDSDTSTRLRKIKPIREKPVASLIIFALTFSLLAALAMILLPMPTNLIISGAFLLTFAVALAKNHRNNVRYTLRHESSV